MNTIASWRPVLAACEDDGDRLDDTGEAAVFLDEALRLAVESRVCGWFQRICAKDKLHIRSAPDMKLESPRGK